MEPESVVRRYYELVDAEAYDDLVALFSDDVVYERPGQAVIEGRAALRAFYREGRPLSDGEHELHSVVVADEGGGSDGEGATIAVRGTFRGVQDGAAVEIGFADFHEVRAGRIRRRYTFTDRDTV